MLLAAFGFSWGFIIVKGVGLPPSAVAFYRTWIGALTLLAWLRARRVPRPRDYAAIVGAGVCFGAHQLLFIGASQATSISIVTLLQGMQPLLVALVSQRLLGEHVPRGLLGSSMLAVAGVAVVVLANRGHGSHSGTGDLLAVANVLAFLGYFLFCKRARTEGIDTVTLTGWALLVAALLVTPAYLWSLPTAPPAPWQLGLLAVHALLPGNGHLLVNWAHARITAALGSLLLSAVPILASVWAFLIFDEPYGPWHVLGTALTLAAIELGRRMTAPVPTAPAGAR